jgi:L-rhamnose mutarotase
MKRVAGIMKVYKDCFAEYKRRHDNIFPEMKKELENHGYHNYSIYLDETTGNLFSYYETDDEKKADSMADTEICKKWWDYMKDVMETNPDNSPVCLDLKEVFHLD